MAILSGTKEVQCQPPPDIQNGAYNNQEGEAFTSEMSVTYTCHPGYILIGEATIYCTMSGTWSSPAPHCKEEMVSTFREQLLTTERPASASPPILTNELLASVHSLKVNYENSGKSCGNPGEPENGRLLVSGDFLFGSAINYSCEEGYTLVGESSRQCLVVSDRKVAWTGSIALCQSISCLPPPDIPHGSHSGRYLDNFFYGTAITYTCDKGHPLIGNASIFCITKDGSNGVWSGRAYCGVVSCPSPQIENGKVETGYSVTYTYNQRITLCCNAGHRLAGSREIYCQVDGTWDPPLPRCEQVSHCPLPPDIANGKNNGTAAIGCTIPEIQNGRMTIFQVLVKPTGTITFECDPGYILKGNQTIECKSDNTWESPVPVCVREVQCQQPPYVQNGAHNKQEATVFTNGMFVEYTCNPGYALTGDAIIYCTDSGIWSFPTPRCTVVQCPQPPYVQNGAYNSQGTAIFTSGITVKYSCETGYILTGEATINCTDSGTWTFPTPRCEVMHCLLPPRIAHGTYIGVDFTYGKSVIYICNAGYSLIGEHVVSCSLQGSHSVNWTEPPKCKGCLAPPKIANGRCDTKILGGDFPYGSVVTYHCDPGYFLTGSATIHCLSSGTWDQPVPQCKRRQFSSCVSPKIQNGKITRSKVEEKSTGMITIECNPGYILKGNHTIRCMSDRMWDSPVPICVKGSPSPLLSVVQCQQPPHVQNGIHNKQEVTVFTSGMAVEYTCNPGYILTGEATIYCIDTGTWSFPTPHCKEVQCPLPPYVQNGTHSNKETAVFTSGMFVKYSCEPGYTIIGEATIYCTDSGTWNPSAPYCGVMHCPVPQKIAHGRYIGEDFTYGKSVIYICDAGYSLIGDHEVTCILEGSNSLNWAEPPKCKGCLAPPEIVNGKHDTEIKEDFPYGSSVTYHCDPGYFLTGAATIYCLSSGTWDQPVPHCKVKQLVECSLPPNVQHGKYNASESTKYSSGKFVKYICEPGYVLKGEATIYCTASGKWSLPVPYCDEIRCQQPPHIQNGTYSNLETEAFSSGMSVRYTCEAGYSLIGEATIYCIESGSWSLPAPRCEVMHCPLPPRIGHGKYIGENFVYGKSVIYICDAGYSLVGQRVVTCILEGSNSVNWTEPPQCKGCLTPPEIANGKYHNGSGILKDFPYGSSVTYHCDPGYFLIGAGTIYCLSSGLWDHSVPQCKVIQSAGCTLPEISGGRKINAETVIEVGNNVTLECEEGYLLNGSPHVQCQHGSMWDPPVPVCKSASYVSAAIGFGSLIVILLLVISGVIGMMFLKRKKTKYIPGKRKIYTGPVSQVQEQSNISV
ncbi:complement receptor type 2 [Sceloporus undulatus]|uniref:complement receptor type 2 n=1 Tax=Sceloporus undulatus TaxID=8520 RepID=UPI001C4B93E3|nr:complement receptor type 2 [Sceloporus undulatus]